jgi:hypothetical protein
MPRRRFGLNDFGTLLMGELRIDETAPFLAGFQTAKIAVF